MQAWKTRSRETVFSQGKYLSVERHAVELPDGRVLADWPWLVMPDYAIVVATDDRGDFLCLRQTKYAVRGTTLAPVGGYVEPGEAPLAAARRELLEEAGCRADDWTPLGSYAVDGNRGAGTAHLFLAGGAHTVAQAHADDLERQELIRLNRCQLQAALEAGEFKVLAWTAAVALALLHDA